MSAGTLLSGLSSYGSGRPSLAGGLSMAGSGVGIGASSLLSQLQHEERRSRALRRWRKIRDRVREVMEQRKQERRTGWTLVVKHLKQVSELDQQRRELYRRYGFDGLQPGALPHSNPMSLFPADVFPTGNEPEIPEALRPALRAHRAYVQQCLIAVRLRRAIPMPRGLIRRPATAAPAAGAALAPIPTGRALLSRLDSMSTPTVRRPIQRAMTAPPRLNRSSTSLFNK